MGIGEWGSVCGLVSLISLVSCSNSTAPATGDFTTALDLMVRDGPSGREAGSIDGAAALGDQMVERDLGGPSSCAPQGSKKILGTWDFGPTFNAVSSNGWLYVAAGGQVRIYDISTKAKLLDLGMTKIAACATPS